MNASLHRIGTAGWAIPRVLRERFPEEGSALQRYAAVFDAAEINSTFYRSHKPATLERWVAAVPEDFRFAVKAPKAITHERRLVEATDLVKAFLDEISALGSKMGPLLVQLPPSLAFDEGVAASFLEDLRGRTDAPIACEPRHASWFEPPADRLMADMGVARVAADPARVPEAGTPGGWAGLVYHRLHGSPRMYYSEYGRGYLAGLAGRLRETRATETWCIFDNTTSGAAAADALCLREQVAAGP